jgi:hypothetical protein
MWFPLDLLIPRQERRMRPINGRHIGNVGQEEGGPARAAAQRITKPSEEKMIQAHENFAVADGDPVRTEHIATALTAGSFAYDDGATQTFEPGGGTTYVEHERRSHGEWYVDSEGRFCSFWPPSYRACYDLHWIVENGSVVGLRFTELERGSVFVGRYR